jgi:hypothetical protein
VPVASGQHQASRTPARTLARLLPIVRDHLGLNVTGIDPQVLRPAYQAGASVQACDGSCCRKGTTVSLDERDRILRHAAVVTAAMTSAARREPKRWFSRKIDRDPDFTAGASVTSRTESGRCVFFRNDGRCALQVAGAAHLGDPWALKPAVCILWPLCIQDGSLELGYGSFTRRRACCAPVRRGARAIAELMQPDEESFARMARPRLSRGGGPASGRARRQPGLQPED